MVVAGTAKHGGVPDIGAQRVIADATIQETTSAENIVSGAADQRVVAGAQPLNSVVA